MTYQQVTFLDGFPYPAQPFSDISAEVYARSRAGYGIVRRGERTTSSSTTTTEAGVLRLAAPVVAGRLYLIPTSSLNLISSVAGDIIQGRLRYTTDGSNPTTSSTLLMSSADTQATFNSEAVPIIAKYYAATAHTLTVMLSVARIGGTGNCSIAVSTSYPTIDLMVIDQGVDPGDNGVDL